MRFFGLIYVYFRIISYLCTNIIDYFVRPNIFARYYAYSEFRLSSHHFITKVDVLVAYLLSFDLRDLHVEDNVRNVLFSNKIRPAHPCRLPESVANIEIISETSKKKASFFRLALKICPSKLLCAHHNCFLTRKKLFPRLGTKNKGSCNIIRAKYWEIR